MTLAHSPAAHTQPGAEQAVVVSDDRFMAPIWLTDAKGRLHQGRSRLGRLQICNLLRWAEDAPEGTAGPVGFEPARGGKPWQVMRPLIDRCLMWARTYQPSDWRDGEWRQGWRRYEAGVTPTGMTVVNAILCGMTLEQMRLARSALRLTEHDSYGYRNRLEPAHGHAYREARRAVHMDMVAKGFAVHHAEPDMWDSEYEWFALSELGVRIATFPGETLSEEITSGWKATTAPEAGAVGTTEGREPKTDTTRQGPDR